MPIQVACTGCQKRLTVRDELVGKRLKCPACGTTFEASAAPMVATGAMGMAPPRSRPQEKKAGVGGSFHVSPMYIVLAALAIIIPTVIAIYTYGPYKVRKQWEEMEPTATSAVEDVVSRAIQAHLSRRGEYDVTKATGGTPRALGATFVFGPMYMSMPDEVGFAGTSTEGAFSGSYFPKTGEVKAIVEIGGTSLPTGVMIRRGEEKLNVTGRVKNGAVFAEIDGKEADIIPPPKRIE